MPVSPKDVEAYVASSDAVDALIKQIDEVLSSPGEKECRYGEKGEHNTDYFYAFSFPGAIKNHEQEQLRKAYKDAGWVAVQVRTVGEASGAPRTQVRLFPVEESHYLTWPKNEALTEEPLRSARAKM